MLGVAISPAITNVNVIQATKATVRFSAQMSMNVREKEHVASTQIVSIRPEIIRVRVALDLKATHMMAVVISTNVFCQTHADRMHFVRISKAVINAIVLQALVAMLDRSPAVKMLTNAHDHHVVAMHCVEMPKEVSSVSAQKVFAAIQCTNVSTSMNVWKIRAEPMLFVPIHQAHSRAHVNQITLEIHSVVAPTSMSVRR